MVTSPKIIFSAPPLSDADVYSGPLGSLNPLCGVVSVEIYGGAGHWKEIESEAVRELKRWKYGS